MQLDHFYFFKVWTIRLKKSFFVKGINFSLPPENLDYVDFLVNFELLCGNIRNLGIFSNEDLDFVKTRTKETYRNYNNNVL